MKNPKLKGWIMEDGVLDTFFEKHVKKDARILDVSCGGGHLLLNLYEKGYSNLAGSDLNDYLQFDEIKGKVDFKAANLNFEPLPFPDQSIDVVTSLHTIEHLENPFHFVREVSRVLKPGGFFILAYPYAWNLHSRIKFLFSANVVGYRMANSHIMFMTREVFDKCLGKRFRRLDTKYNKGKIKFPLLSRIPLPSGSMFSTGVCYFFEKQYFADKPY